MVDVFALALVVTICLTLSAYAAYAKYLEYKQADFKHRLIMVMQTVLAAEQKFRGAGRGAAKFAWAVGVLQRIYPDLPTEQIDVMIDAAVEHIKKRADAPGAVGQN